MSPLSVRCLYCDSPAFKPCTRPTGKPCHPHRQRLEDALMEVHLQDLTVVANEMQLVAVDLVTGVQTWKLRAA